jgi:hypothetical protein
LPAILEDVSDRQPRGRSTLSVDGVVEEVCLAGLVKQDGRKLARGEGVERTTVTESDRSRRAESRGRASGLRWRESAKKR